MLRKELCTLSLMSAASTQLAAQRNLGLTPKSPPQRFSLSWVDTRQDPILGFC